MAPIKVDPGAPDALDAATAGHASMEANRLSPDLLIVAPRY
ncbi:hypothetical protein [Arthrobacter sp. CDRTa11]|nr:hypothetical protein [Arthrobacter sp. CDRTa11]